MASNGPDIRCLFEPRAVAVVGASHTPGKIGHTILKNIVDGGYEGEVYPVNPKGGEILGHTVYQNPSDCPGEIDLAVTAVPAKHAIQAVKDLADCRTKYNLVITSGFSEVGNLEDERELVSYATERGMRILGPNIFGMFSASSSLDATFGPGGILHGSVAIITQSGALGLAMIGKTAVESVGISAMISVGNKADVDEADLLHYLMDDEHTRAILMYIEGVRDGERLLAVLDETTQKKPVVAIKSGRSKRGAVAAASHTGSLAGSDDIFDAVMRQVGVIRAESVEEAFNLCKFLSRTVVPKGRNAAIVTNGGGIGVLATDACEKYEVPLYDDQAKLREIFEPATPDFGSTKNPIDLTGQATAEDYRVALDAAQKSDAIESVLALYCETALFTAADLVSMIRDTYAQYQEGGKPVLYSVFGGSETEKSLSVLNNERIPVFGDVYETVACLGGLYQYGRHLAERTGATDDAELDVGAVKRIVARARADGRGFLLADEGQELMKTVGIGLPESRVARTIQDAVEAAEDLGYPVVMKVVSRDILHKSDVGGVALGLEDRDEVMDAYQAIMRNAKSRMPDARIKGVEVAEMVQSGVELIVGARRDASFGPIVMFGMGGIYVEVLKDVSFRAVPLDRREVLSMMKEIRAYPLLLGVRGEARRDIEGVTDAIIRLATLIRHCPEISDIEVNPLVAYEQGHGTKAVDVRVLLAEPAGGGTDA
ncbi:MAG: CoA-binding protein [Candidatus Eisenbacteria bacterium]|nr:CoA-binding protein [Candidatus Eisenbacteria bacterium]